MKTVTIPSDYNPFVVKVNNQEYFYKAGETVEVPDEVAEVILHYTDAKAQEPEKLEYIEGFSYDPVSDAGKVLQVRDDGRGVEWGANSGGGGGGSSPFDEWLGVTGYAEVTVNYTFPSGSSDTGLVSGSYDIQIGTFDEYYELQQIYDIRIMNPELFAGSNSFTVKVPLFDNMDTTLYNFYLIGTNNQYVIDSVELSGDITSESNYYVVTGDGVINATLTYS